jgi:hypothetical protein
MIIKDKIKTKIVMSDSVGANFLNQKLKRENKFSGVHPKEFRVFLRMVKRSIFHNWMNEKCKMELVDSVSIKKHRNRDKWDSIKDGSSFYLIDMVSCYWQMAYKLGYIDKALFDRFMYNDDYKQAKRLCFTLLKKNTVLAEYCIGSDVVNSVVCDSTIANNVFFNIRNMSSVYINELVGLLGNEYLFFNVDGIAVCDDKYIDVSNYFKDKDIKVSVYRCTKTVDNKYVVNNQSKRI